MSKPLAKERIYIIDADAFIELGQIDDRVVQLPEEVWKQIEVLLQKGKIISSRYVYDEVVINPQKPNKPMDNVSKWLAPQKAYFIKENTQQIRYMIEVIGEFPKLINPEYEKSQADPWLIALARDLSEQNPDKEFVLVTQENPASSTKLPAACSNYGIKTINLRQFFDEVGLKLGIQGL